MKKNVVTLVYLLGAMMLWLLIPATAYAESAKELYCLFNPVSGEYLYTVDENEKASLESAWYLEGVVGKLPSESSMPIYRLYNPVSGLHLYTADPAEISKLTGEGWTNENVAFYVAEENAAPIYRLFDPKTGEHAFGSDATAAKMEQNGWTREGVAFYATWANSDLIYTGKKTGAGTTTTTAANTTTTTNTGGAVLHAPGKWYDGLQRNVWYDAGDYFFYIPETDDDTKDAVYSQKAYTYWQIILPRRFPDRAADIGMWGEWAKGAGGVPVAVVSSIGSHGDAYAQADYPWFQNSKKSVAGAKVDTTFEPFGSDSPWGELYVVHGTGLGAYYYKVESNGGENLYYDARDFAAGCDMSDSLYDAYGGIQNAVAVFGSNFTKSSDLVGTWNGLTIRRVYWDM